MNSCSLHSEKCSVHQKWAKFLLLQLSKASFLVHEHQVTECQLEKLRFGWEKSLTTWTKSSFTPKSENLGDWRPPLRGRSDPLGSQLAGREGWSKWSKRGDSGTAGVAVVKLGRGTPWVGGQCKLKKFCWHNHHKAGGQLTSNPALIPTPKSRQGKTRGTLDLIEFI